MYFSPIEAVPNRLSDISISNGNFIIDIVNGKLFYDTYDKKRINLSAITFFDTAQELLATTGIKDKLYIAKDTGVIYYWINSWVPITVSGSSSGGSGSGSGSESGDSSDSSDIQNEDITDEDFSTMFTDD